MKLSRRGFLESLSAVALGGCTTVKTNPTPASGSSGVLKFAGVGVGGMGGSTCHALEKAGAELVAICDIDTSALARWDETHPNLPKFTDYREMLAKCGHLFDAVEVGTPDHTHAYIAADCMNAGKHVYVQKPLARTVAECEILRECARRNGVVTQMGNQGHPGVWYYKALRDAGAWGEIKELFSWSNRPIWPQGMTQYPDPDALPDSITPAAWDCWCGPSADHGFSRAYHSFRWRGWWDYGCGAIGDMAVHNADPAFWALELGLPVKVKADTYGTGPVTIAYPKKSRIEMWFGPNNWIPNGMKLTWFDGGLKPTRADVAGINPGVNIPDNGLIVRGEKATTLGASHASAPLGIAGAGGKWDANAKATQKEVAQIVKAARDSAKYSHYREFIDACLAGDPERCGSKFSYAATLTEALLVGCIALRYPGEELRFDPVKLEFTDKPEANEWLQAPKRGAWDFSKLDRPWWRPTIFNVNV